MAPRRGHGGPATGRDRGRETTSKGKLPMAAASTLPPTVDLDAQGLMAEGKLVARALQDFGVCVPAQPLARGRSSAAERMTP